MYLKYTSTYSRMLVPKVVAVTLRRKPAPWFGRLLLRKRTSASDSCVKARANCSKSDGSYMSVPHAAASSVPFVWSPLRGTSRICAHEHAISAESCCFHGLREKCTRAEHRTGHLEPVQVVARAPGEQGVRAAPSALRRLHVLEIGGEQLEASHEAGRHVHQPAAVECRRVARACARRVAGTGDEHTGAGPRQSLEPSSASGRRHEREARAEAAADHRAVCVEAQSESVRRRVEKQRRVCGGHRGRTSVARAAVDAENDLRIRLGGPGPGRGANECGH